MREAEALAARVRERLRGVIDPELGHNIVDLGLIYDIAASAEGRVAVSMTTTMRACPAAGFLKEAVAGCILEIDGVTAVEVTLVYEPAWSPDRISGAAAAAFAAGP